MDRLYYTDSYLQEFTASVIPTGADPLRVCLDQTAFYPTSGGQPHDLGSLNGINVVDVVDEDERIVHVMERPLAASKVTGTIDWVRRYDHMQQHTGQHLLSAVFQDMLSAPTLSFHMGVGISTIDLAVKEITEDQISAVGERVNEIARESASIAITFEDATEANGLRKQSGREGMLRIVSIPGVDRSACGGTHVQNLHEVLPVQLRRLEKMRGNVRLEFACGDRAIRLAGQDFRTLGQLVRLAGTTPENAIPHFMSLRQRATDAEKDRLRLSNRMAEREATDQYAATKPSLDGVHRCCMRVGSIDETQRLKVQAYAKQPMAVLVLFSPESAIVACSADSGMNAGSILKQTVALHGGSGGGSSMMAQGRLAGSEGEKALLLAAGFDLGDSAVILA